MKGPQGLMLLILVLVGCRDSERDTAAIYSAAVESALRNFNHVYGAPDAAEIQSVLGAPIVNSLKMVLVPIPAGEFVMGSPASEEGHHHSEFQHSVRITQPFYLSATEVTQQEYETLMGDNPSISKGKNKPVEMVSWNDAVNFCRKLSNQEHREYRLPTEAEWEYACRAATNTPFNFGNNTSRIGGYAIYDTSETHPVGEKKSNEWGLYDMHGNVWEWCQDWFAPYGNEMLVLDPTGPPEGDRRVLRGGAFCWPPVVLRSAVRIDNEPTYRSSRLGFRVACDLSP